MAEPTRIDDRTWLISCPRCHRWRPLAEVGGARIGARSRSKRGLGWCRYCRWFRLLRIEQLGQIPPDRLQRMIDATDRN